MPPLVQRVLLALAVFSVALLGLAASTGALADVAPLGPPRPVPPPVLVEANLIPELGGPGPVEVQRPDTTIPEVGQPPLWVRPRPSPLQQVLPVEDPVPY